MEIFEIIMLVIMNLFIDGPQSDDLEGEKE